MIFLEIATDLILLSSFVYGVIKLWRKGKPLYFQIITCAIGCCFLFNLAVVVMSYCNVNETYFNTSFFGLLGCNLFLFCANNGALEKIFEKPKTKFLIISILAGIVEFAVSFVTGFFYFGPKNFVFYAFIVVQAPLAFVVYFVTKHFFSEKDDLGLKNAILLSDIFTLLYCVCVNLDILSWLKYGIFSSICDVILALIVLGLSITSVEGAKKWNF